MEGITMNNKYVLGLDIGVTSCGYGVIDLETGRFVDYGVRLFEEGKAKIIKIEEKQEVVDV